MPRFFFHVQDGTSSRDHEGTEYASIEDARVESVRRAGALLSDAATTFWNGDQWRLEVTDAVGLILFTLDFVGTQSPAVRDLDHRSRAAS